MGDLGLDAAAKVTTSEEYKPVDAIVAPQGDIPTSSEAIKGGRRHPHEFEHEAAVRHPLAAAA